MNQRHFLILLLTMILAVLPIMAQDDGIEATSDGAEATSSDGVTPDEEMPSYFETITTTATLTPTDVFDIATPVAVIPEAEIDRMAPENSVDLLRNQPGVDVNGVGPNQARPIIRGQRGLRILFMENGLRLNNARRQTDFGEVSGLVDTDSISTIEVVRGPASVLYGTDAIGGVMNLVTKKPAYGNGAWVSGEIGQRYSSAADQSRSNAFIQGRQEKWSFNLGGSYRDSKDYESASGSFGAIKLDDQVTVIDTGLKDKTVFGYLGYDLSDTRTLAFRFNRYRADQTGFGFVDPLLLGELDQIRIFYPFQDFDRFTLNYTDINVGSIVSDTMNINLMHQKNDRQLANDIDAYSPAGPGQFIHVAADTINETILETTGFRGEVTKHLGNNNMVTWGGEYYADESVNTDSSIIIGTIAAQFEPGTRPVDVSPPIFSAEDDISNTPNADFINYGFFVQDQFMLGNRLSAIAGIRYSKNETNANPTRGHDVTGLDFSDNQVVGALNLVYEATDHLNLLGTWGTAFRAPSIVERLFNGVTPEGSGYQLLNPDLVSEESENFDIGLKYRRSNAVLEVVYFRNDIDNGIIQNFLSPEEIAALPAEVREVIEMTGIQYVVQQQNIDRLRHEGVEAMIGYHMTNGFSIGANYTWLDAQRIDSEHPPTGDTYSNKLNFYTRYDRPSGRYWLEYRLRSNGEADLVTDPDEPIPAVGARLPSFTIHTIGGGVTLFRTSSQEHQLNLIVENVTDELYSEFSNTSFFRPQPGRNVIVNYRLTL